MLESLTVATGPNPTGSVVWLHGLGADGHDFEPIVPELVRPGERPLRFIFPHAPIRPVTLNGGTAMRAWYDIIGLNRQARQDDAGISASDAAVRSLIATENARGIASDRIVLAGFSQGGAQALYTGTRLPDRLAGIIGLSCYLLGAAWFAAARTAANEATPIFLGHGRFDQVVDPDLGEDARRMLEAADYPVEWHTYPIPHAVCPEELGHIAAWLRRTLP